MNNSINPRPVLGLKKKTSKVKAPVNPAILTVHMLKDIYPAMSQGKLLAIGSLGLIVKDLKAQGIAISVVEIRQGIAYYCSSSKYLRNTVEGALRHHLDGSPVTTSDAKVTAKQAAWAAHKHSKLHGKGA